MNNDIPKSKLIWGQLAPAHSVNKPTAKGWAIASVKKNGTVHRIDLAPIVALPGMVTDPRTIVRARQLEDLFGNAMMLFRLFCDRMVIRLTELVPDDDEPIDCDDERYTEIHRLEDRIASCGRIMAKVNARLYPEGHPLDLWDGEGDVPHDFCPSVLRLVA